MATTAEALTVDPDQQAILKELAARELRSPEVLLRDAVQQYLLKHLQTAELAGGKDPWDSYDGPTFSEAELLDESRASWKHFQQTGLHLTQDEVCAWVESLKTDPHAKLPECHT